jgi:hypothetical protein
MNGRRESGLTRRELLKRSAIAGTAAVWVTPVIESLLAPAGATGTHPTTTTIKTTTTVRNTCLPGSPFTQDIECVAALLVCNNKRYRVRWSINTDNSVKTDCGTSFTCWSCTEQLRGYVVAGTLTNNCPPVTPYYNATTGELTVNLGTCTVLAYVVKCGSKAFQMQGTFQSHDAVGCDNPAEKIAATTLPQSSTVTFQPCRLSGSVPGYGDEDARSGYGDDDDDDGKEPGDCDDNLDNDDEDDDNDDNDGHDEDGDGRDHDGDDLNVKKST